MPFKKLFASLACIAVVAGVVLGIGAVLQMNTSGHMARCPFFGDLNSMCPWNVVDHIAQWQTIFAAILQSTFTASAFIGILLYATVILAGFFFLWAPPRFRSQNRSKQLLESRLPMDHLRLAFSRGILHSRVYA